VNGIHEVAGSSPASSTADPHPPLPVMIGADSLRVRLGYWIDWVAAGEEVIITRRGRPRVRVSPTVDARLR
jgi:prevent-host-death family protein